jgi:uncharacterized membrane protein YhhN
MMTLYVLIWGMPGVSQMLFNGFLPSSWHVVFVGAVYKAAPIVALARGSLELAGALSARAQASDNEAVGAVAAFGRYLGFGLLMSSVGDFALDVETLYPHLFLVGLVFFLLAHLSYVRGFHALGLVHSVPLGMLVAGFPLGMNLLLWPHLQSETNSPLRVPVFMYSAAIGLMVYTSAAARVAPGVQGLGTAKTLGFLGAVTFALSDSILAWDKFAAPLPLKLGKVAVMVTYYAAQLLVGAAVAVAVRRVAEAVDAAGKGPGAAAAAAAKGAESKKNK